MELVVGRVVKAHGISGEVVVEIRTDDPADRFAPGTTLRAKRSRDGGAQSAAMSSTARVSTAGGCWCDWPEWPTATPPTRCVAVCSSSTPMTCRPSTSRTPTTTTNWKAFGSGRHGNRGRRRHRGAAHRRPVNCWRSSGDPGGEVLVPFVSAIVTSVSLDDGTVEIDPPDGLLDLA